jgi:xylulokinase
VTEAEPVVLAIDLGTTDVKAGLVAAGGSLLGLARVDVAVEVDGPTGAAEQDPERWWAALRDVVRALGIPARGRQPAAVCVVGQGPTLVPVDRDGRATHPAVTWLDSRPAGEAPGLEAATGLTGWGLGILPAARWLERTEPSAADRTAWYLNAWEWAALRIGGTAATTRSLGQVLPDPRLVAAAGLAVERLPPVLPSGSVVGAATAAASRDLGIPAGLPVVAGMVDSYASFHGAGLVDGGDAVDTGGTSGGLALYLDSAIDVPGAWVAAAPLPHRWMVGGAMTATGRSLDWLAEDALGGNPVAELVTEAASVAPGADGLLFLPYLAGERSPIWDPLARGAFVGLTLGHGRAHLARAVLEAAAFALRHVAEPIRDAGLRIDHLVVTGGTARSDSWNAIKADVLGVPVVVPAERETALVGAAVLASTALDWHADAASAIRAMVRTDHRIEPDPVSRGAYDEAFAAYKALWPAIAPVSHRLHYPVTVR